MKHTLAAVCGGTLLIISAHRLPAPISEVETPTPAKQSAKPKQRKLPKSTPKSVATESTSNPARQQPSSKQSRFAGTWVGTMQTIPWGNWAVVLTVDPNEATITSEINGGKPEVKKAQRNGDMLQATFAAGLTVITWSLTPQPDGATARVRMQAFMNDFTAVFHRTVAESSSAKTAR